MNQYNIQHPDYTIDGDRLIYVSRHKGYIYTGTFTSEIQQIFKKAYRATHNTKRYGKKPLAPKPEYVIHLADNEIVAINRFLMGKDAQLDLNNITSRAKRRQNIGDNLINWLK